MTSLEEGKWLIFPTNDLKHNRHLRGQKNYDIGDYDDDDDDIYDDDVDDDNDDYNVFSLSQGPQIGLAPGGGGGGWYLVFEAPL